MSYQSYGRHGSLLSCPGVFPGQGEIDFPQRHWHRLDCSLGEGAAAIGFGLGRFILRVHKTDSVRGTFHSQPVRWQLVQSRGTVLKIHLHPAEAAKQRLNRLIQTPASLVYHHNAVGETLDLLDVVLREKNGPFALLGSQQERLRHILADHGIETAERLIQK